MRAIAAQQAATEATIDETHDDSDPAIDAQHRFADSTGAAMVSGLATSRETTVP